MTEQCGNCYYWRPYTEKGPVGACCKPRTRDKHKMLWCVLWRAKGEKQQQPLPCDNDLYKLEEQLDAADKLCEAARITARQIAGGLTVKDSGCSRMLDDAITAYEAAREEKL